MKSDSPWHPWAQPGRPADNAPLPPPPESSAIRAEARRRSRAQSRRLSGLALTAAVAVALLPRPQNPSLEERVDRASHWLLAQQQADGSWSAGVTAQRFPAHHLGVTSLAVLGLLENESRSAESLRSARRGLAWILARQQTDGSFAPPGPDRLTVHGMATRALALAHQQGLLAPEHAPAVKQAEHFLVRAQLPEGGWGYDVPADGFSYQDTPAITSASVWPIRALALDPHFKKAYARSLDWIAAQRTTDGGYRYRKNHAPTDGATLMGALCLQEAGRIPASDQPATSPPPSDLYLGYFHAACGDDSAYKKALANRQQEDGSWPMDDRWSTPGGPVYSTAMALLTLASD